MKPATPDAASNLAPIDFETDIAELPLHGTLPPGLRGTLVRNGPNPLVPRPGAHWFSGDGMLHAFRIERGRVSYRNRWVRTQRFEAARSSGMNLDRGLQASRPDRQLEADDGVANTHVVAHAGRMLALEEAHLPIEVVCGTLETRGVFDFGGPLGERFTAHPKTDPRTGEMLFFGYGTPEPLSRGMSFGSISRGGRVQRFERFEAPFASMVHDFAITANHVIFPVMPLTASRERAMAGLPPYAWEPAYGTQVGVLPRGGDASQIVWFRGPPCFVFHTMNAWEEGSSVFVDLMQFERPPLFPSPDGRPAAGADETARLTRWRIDLDDPRREFVRMPLGMVTGEFPRIDERRMGLPYRHGWLVGNVDGVGDPMQPG
ncbi:MAG: carotenoid oxygenase family protein, partial [Solirubrobacteraceae bacterium]|nr:carotenoid oxygenase family protein [Solirubrobacteraceae bacterium]